MFEKMLPPPLTHIPLHDVQYGLRSVLFQARLLRRQNMGFLWDFYDLAYSALTQAYPTPAHERDTIAKTAREILQDYNTKHKTYAPSDKQQKLILDEPIEQQLKLLASYTLRLIEAVTDLAMLERPLTPNDEL